MPLTLSQKSDVRRHLGYPVAGLIKVSPAGQSFASGAVGYRFTEAYGFLEYKMNNLGPDEEARINGAALAAVALTSVQPNEGDTFSITFSGGNLQAPQTITVTCPANLQGQDMRLVIAQLLANAVSLNATMNAAGFTAVAPYGTGPYANTVIPVPEVGFQSPVPFQISVSQSVDATTALTITATGANLDPVASLTAGNASIATPIWGYIPILNAIHSGHAQSSENLDTQRADVWYARSNEIGQRTSLYRMWQAMLSDYLGTPINTKRTNNLSKMGGMRFM
jgi:hypothetical protein